MDPEINPSDFLEMGVVVSEEGAHALPQPLPQQQQDPGVFQHYNKQHELYVCSLCNKAFSSKGHLLAHAHVHDGVVIGKKVITDDPTSYKTHQCDLCNKSYASHKHLWAHVSKIHKGDPALTCGYCSRIYSARMRLEKHLHFSHQVIPPSCFQCKTCPNMYTNDTDLNKHAIACLGMQQRKEQQLANNSFNAPQFVKLKNALEPGISDTSSVNSDYENNDYKRAEARLAKTPELIIQKYSLIKVNSAQKGYEELQNMFCKQKEQTYVVHEESMENENKRWYCTACTLNFGSVDEFRQHEKIHAEKPFALCQKDFSLKSSLGGHIISSQDIDPTPLVESDKCLKKSVQESNIQVSLIKEEQNITKDNSMSPFSTDNMNNDDEEEHVSGTENLLNTKVVFVCELCTRDCNDRYSLWCHMCVAHKEYAAFACGLCLRICEDNTQLRSHVTMYHTGPKLTMSEQRKFSCKICGRQHNIRKNLIAHVSIHNIDPDADPASFVQLNTNYFGENVNSSEAGNEDLIMNCNDDSEKVDCYICYKSYPSEKLLMIHQRRSHRAKQMVPVGEFGPDGGQSGQNGTRKKRSYQRSSFPCQLCGSSHPSKWQRWLHVNRMHNNEASIKCEHDDCAKVFATKALRNKHMQHHQVQGKLPITCEICGKLWDNRADHWQHVRNVHMDILPLICNVCLKVCPDAMQLSQHVKLKHWPLINGDFNCDVCGKSYVCKNYMLRHRKIHGLDGEPYI